ncbi:hypothetical protein BOTCAL_0487g00020 [Botryotinia calthae]|uniref:Uncharacterized protein n=1 Tax=Botryotinia calthae TaxID=38488 RepID=A0A4Y8CLS0_9HELO|nr:hypothetical protein BOTCAL_0487g00020 [Botryotinia calthae]
MQRESIVWVLSLPLFLLHFDPIVVRIQSTSSWKRIPETSIDGPSIKWSSDIAVAEIASNNSLDQ